MSSTPPQTFDEWLASHILSIEGKLDILMTQEANLNAGMAQLQKDLSSVAAGIAAEIQQLKDAQAGNAPLDAAVTNAINGLNAAHATLSKAASDLAADDPAAPPSP